MHVLVTGGTGTLGRRLVPRLLDAGHDVRVLTRRSMPKLPTGARPVHGDVLDRSSLLRAMLDVEVVVHAATSPQRHAHRVEVDGTRHVVAAAEDAPVGHLLYVSIVGIDHHPWPYYQAKLAAESVVAAAAVPWTIQRATQYFDLIDYVLTRFARAPFVFPVPRRVRLQPVDTDEVAARLVSVVGRKAVGRAPDFAGPEVLESHELARAWAAATGHPRRLVPLPVPGRSIAAYRAGAALCADCTTGTRTWADYLAARYPAPS